MLYLQEVARLERCRLTFTDITSHEIQLPKDQTLVLLYRSLFFTCALQEVTNKQKMEKIMILSSRLFYCGISFVGKKKVQGKFRMYMILSSIGLQNTRPGNPANAHSTYLETSFKILFEHSYSRRKSQIHYIFYSWLSGFFFAKCHDTI